jgi:hypothetical protein
MASFAVSTVEPRSLDSAFWAWNSAAYPELRKLDPEALRKQADRYLPKNMIPVAAAREKMSAIYQRAADDLLAGAPVHLGVRVSAGTGKTEASIALFIHLAKQNYDGGAIYLAPTHDNLKEFQDRAGKQGIEVVIFRGKDHEDENGETLCVRADEIKLHREVGLDNETLHFCGDLRNPGESNENLCPHFASCPYRLQGKEFDPLTQIGAATLNAMANGLPPGVADKVKTVIADEAIRQAMIQKLAPVNVESFLRQKNFSRRFGSSASGIFDVLTTIKAALDEKVSEIEALAAIEIEVKGEKTKVTAAVLRNLAKFIVGKLDRPKPGMLASKVRFTLAKLNPNEVAIAQMLRFLADAMDSGKARDHGLWSQGKESDVIERLFRRDLHESLQSKNLILMDADLDETITKALLPNLDIQFEAINAIRHTYVTQVFDQTLSKGTLEGNRLNGSSSVEDVRLALKKIAEKHQGKKILAITGKSFEGMLNDGWKKPKGVTIATAHFGAIRGLDTYKNFDVIVIIGRNEPPVEAVEHMSCCLFEDRIDRRTLTGKTAKGSRPIAMASGDIEMGQGSYHANDLCQLTLEQIRECESLQAIDRGRGVSREGNPLNVYVFCDLPLPGLVVNERISWKKFVSKLTKWGHFTSQNLKAESAMPLSPAEMVRSDKKIFKDPIFAASVARDINRDLGKKAKMYDKDACRLRDHLPEHLTLLKVGYRPEGSSGGILRPALVLMDLGDVSRLSKIERNVEMMTRIEKVLERGLGPCSAFELLEIWPAPKPDLEPIEPDEFDLDDDGPGVDQDVIAAYFSTDFEALYDQSRAKPVPEVSTASAPRGLGPLRSRPLAVKKPSLKEDVSKVSKRVQDLDDDDDVGPDGNAYSQEIQDIQDIQDIMKAFPGASVQWNAPPKRWLN